MSAPKVLFFQGFERLPEALDAGRARMTSGCPREMQLQKVENSLFGLVFRT